MTTSPVMTVTDELLAELAQELNRCKFSDDGDGDESWPSISGEAVSALITELRRLRAENAELAKDAGRIEWLSEQFKTCTVDMGGQHPYSPSSIKLRGMRGPTFRHAIDTAMASK